MFDAESGSNIDLGISLAHPWSSDVFPSSAEATGVAANQRETRKMSKYEQHKLPGGSVVKSFHWLWNILDHGEKKREIFCRNWQPFHQMKQEDLMLQNS